MTHSDLNAETAAALAKINAAEVETIAAMRQAIQAFDELMQDFAAAMVDYQKARAEVAELAKPDLRHRLRLARAL